VAPYASLNYSEFDRGLNFPFGAAVQIGSQFTLVPMYDGHASHTMLTWSGKHESLSLILAWNRRVGLSVGLAF
jgi:hypothetical protein